MLLPICAFSLEKCLFKSFVKFWFGLFNFCYELKKFLIYFGFQSLIYWRGAWQFTPVFLSGRLNTHSLIFRHTCQSRLLLARGRGQWERWLQRDSAEKVWGATKLLSLDFGGRPMTLCIYQNLVLYATEGKFYWIWNKTKLKIKKIISQGIGHL